MGDEVTGAGLSARWLFASTPDAEAVKDTVPLPLTSYRQVKLAELPPPSTVPAAEAGAPARVAPALPAAAMAGAGRASRRTSAPPVLRTISVSDTGFWPAEALAGETDAETERAPGACTVTGWLAAVTPAIATPAFASVPEAEQENASVPLPEAFHTQVKILVAPPARRSPAGEGGEEESEAAADPPAVTIGVGSASSRTAAPPVFCSVRTSETCCSPADTCPGDAVAVAASAPGACASTAGADAAGGLTGVPLSASVPLAVAAKARVPLPETSYCQENVCDAPPASTVPPADGGETATAAAADPVARRVGAGSGSSRSEAPPVLVAVSATWTRCSPAETRRGDAASESASAAGASIASAAVLAAAGARVAPVLDSVALADDRQETVPLPEASNVQVKSRLPPECRTRPDAEAGCETIATAALPVVAATGGGRSESMTSAPPEFVAVSVSEGRCTPAEIRAGPATAEIASTPASCASTVALVIGPVEGVIEGSFPSVPCALTTNATWPVDLAEVVQMNETLWPPCNTAMVPAEAGVIASELAVVPAAVAGAAGETLVASAWPVFCTTNVSWSVCPTLTRARSVVNVPVNCAGACNIRFAVEGDTVAAPPPCTVPDPFAVSWAGPAEFAVTWKVNVAELPGASFCAVSAGPLMVRVPSPGLLRCETEAMAVSTAVCPLLVSWTRRLSTCPTETVAGTPTRLAIRPPGRSTARGPLVALPMRCAEVLVSVPVTPTWTVRVPAPGAGVTSNVNDSRAPPASGPAGTAAIAVGVTAAPEALVRSSAQRLRPAIAAPLVFRISSDR